MYVVANGNSFITARGSIGPGEEIRESDFANKATFLKRVADGRIVIGKTNAQLEKEACEKRKAAEKAASEEADRKKQEAKAKAAERVTLAEAALENAQSVQTAAKEAADKVVKDIKANRKPQFDDLAKKIGICEKAVKETESASGKAKPEDKEAAENNVLAAMEALEAAKKELKDAELAIEESPELKKALDAAEKAADSVIAAEANLAEAKEAAGKAE